MITVDKGAGAGVVRSTRESIHDQYGACQGKPERLVAVAPWAMSSARCPRMAISQSLRHMYGR